MGPFPHWASVVNPQARWTKKTRQITTAFHVRCFSCGFHRAWLIHLTLEQVCKTRTAWNPVPSPWAIKRLWLKLQDLQAVKIVKLCEIDLFRKFSASQLHPLDQWPSDSLKRFVVVLWKGLDDLVATKWSKCNKCRHMSSQNPCCAMLCLGFALCRIQPLSYPAYLAYLSSLSWYILFLNPPDKSLGGIHISDSRFQTGLGLKGEHAIGSRQAHDQNIQAPGKCGLCYSGGDRIKVI